MVNELTWTCAVCDRPVADGSGHLVIEMSQVTVAEDRWSAFTTEHAGGYSLDELLDAPDPVPWRAVHVDCEPDSGPYAIEIAKVRTHAGLLAWTAHLMSKSWLRVTDWSSVIARQAGTGLV